MAALLANSELDFFDTLTALLMNPWAGLIYITITAVILFLFARTRLVALYVLKTAWITVTMFAFLWVVVTSMGSNRQYVQHPEQAITQFVDPGSGVSFVAGMATIACVALIILLRWLMPVREFDTAGKARVLAIRIALGAGAAGGLIIAAHFNGYDRWWENYTTALLVARMGEYALNSVLITIGAVTITICCASMAAYALSKLQFFGRDGFLYLFIAGFAIPGQLILVPLFLMMRHWTIPALGFSFMDSRFGLIIIYAAMGLPFSIFLLTAFFRSLPSELGEAAAIDGCDEFSTFRKVYFPLAMPGITTAAIFNFLGVWNEYNFALVFITNPRLKTLPVGLYTLNVSQQYAANWPALFSGIVILWAPTFLIFLILQKQIIAGLTLGSVKG